MRQQTADKMLELFRDHGWWKQGQTSPKGECLRTAAFLAAESPEEEAQVLRDMQAQIRAQVPGLVERDGEPGIEVAAFNDHPGVGRRRMRRVVLMAVDW
jgi:hypothetical protein